MIASEQGMAKGRAEGIVEGTLSALKDLMETLNLSLDQAMTTLKISEADRQRYTDLIAKQQH